MKKLQKIFHFFLDSVKSSDTGDDMTTEDGFIENLNAAIIKECRSLLITCDYKGKESKEVALATLEEIAFNRGYKACHDFNTKLNENRTN